MHHYSNLLLTVLTCTSLSLVSMEHDSSKLLPKAHFEQNLRIAIENNNVDAVEQILSKEAVYDGREHETDRTYLHYAAALPTSDILFLVMSTMLKKQVLSSCINARDRDGDTPLHQAVKADSIDNVRMLIRWGANVNVGTLKTSLLARNRENNVLMLALRKNPTLNTAIIHLLMEAGVAVNISNSQDTIPLKFFLPFPTTFYPQKVLPAGVSDNAIVFLDDHTKLYWKPNALKNYAVVQTFLFAYPHALVPHLCEYASQVAFCNTTTNRELGTTDFMRLITESRNDALHTKMLRELQDHRALHPELLLMNHNGQTLFDILTIRFKKIDPISNDSLIKQDHRFYVLIAHLTLKRLRYLMLWIWHQGTIHSKTESFVDFVNDQIPLEVWDLIFSFVVGSYLHRKFYRILNLKHA